MKPVDHIVAAVADPDVPRRAWTAPAARRLATSSAEAGDTIAFDATELPS
ncbi:MAG TPA: hypothetical protein VE053_14770 [Allosphingosinicella sp.]|nr:hypothetical protein [Allosphingosinicella sp.]